MNKEETDEKLAELAVLRHALRMIRSELSGIDINDLTLAETKILALIHNLELPD